jgi:acetyl esterase/lipase
MSCLDNFSLRPDMMKFLIKQYVGEYELQNKDPFLNPIKLNNFILERIKSKIRIYFGSQDVLRDDSIKLLNVFSQYNNRSDKNKIDARGYDILGLLHGFNGQRENIQKISRNLIFPEIEQFLGNIS